MNEQTGYFRSVKPLPEHKLEVDLETGSRIVFDFTSRLGTIRFGMLKHDEVFNTAATDGDAILFYKDGVANNIKISASEFMDMVLVDRAGEYPGEDK
jgi:hypothetical protein